VAPVKFDDLRDRLVTRLGHRRSIATFVAAGSREPVLGLFATPLAAIDSLLGLKIARAQYHGRGADALLRAIISEYQAGNVDLWPTMLVVAFYPAILRLWRRIRTDSHEFDELRDLVVESFLSGARALRRVRDVTLIPVRLRTEMERRAFAEVKETCADRSLTRDLVTEALDRGRIEPFVAGRSEATPHHADEVLELEEMTEALVASAPGALTVMNAPEPSLRQLTRALRPDLTPADQERLYQRIKRRYLRHRTDGVDATSLPPWWRALTDPKEDERRRR
jgi:hypothetical protein